MTTEAPARIGLVASDPLRLVGMEAILADLPGMEAVPLELDHIGSATDLAVLMLEARSGGDAIPDLISRLRREHPQLRIVVVGEGLEPRAHRDSHRRRRQRLSRRNRQRSRDPHGPRGGP